MESFPRNQTSLEKTSGVSMSDFLLRFFDFHKIYIRTFVDIVATEYRPGFILLSGNDFVLSTSLPLITLANIVPLHALMAWGRRLLAPLQYLTLLISGFYGLYPVLERDASYTPIAQRLGVYLNFKVGLCERYQPAREKLSGNMVLSRWKRKTS